MAEKKSLPVTAALFGLEEDLARDLTSTLTGCRQVRLADSSGRKLPQADVIFCPADVSRVRQLRDQFPKSSVIVASRLPEVAEWLDALEAGAADYCAAPLSRRRSAGFSSLLFARLRPRRNSWRPARPVFISFSDCRDAGYGRPPALRSSRDNVDPLQRLRYPLDAREGDLRMTARLTLFLWVSLGPLIAGQPSPTHGLYHFERASRRVAPAKLTGAKLREPLRKVRRPAG